MEKRKMILDCDTGHDDAIALMVASKHPQIDLLGVTVVAGNSTLPKTLRNTLNVVQHLGLEVPVYAGCDRPLVRDQDVADDIHGESGLDGPVFPELHIQAQEKHAVLYLIETLLASEGDITLVPVGPLTNIAMAMRLEPKIVPLIKEIVLMGGAVGLGNATPAAEFNIYADPEAAHIVFTSGVPVTMMGLDLTNTALADMKVIERMEALGNKAGKLFGDIMRFTFHSQAVNGLSAGPVHDVTAVTYLVAPELYQTKKMYVQIDTNMQGPCYGRTVCDMNNRYHKEPNVNVGLAIDLEPFWDLVADTLQRHI
ncbi:MAG: ribosylpyrimidine nucleosidase [Erysipelotrichaceae bacterium]|nr:ribosylpyrimidine nucleosidase [Erysipelotrichaceae bacterium]